LDLLVFDLDGTLIDSKLDLANSVNATRAQMRLEALPNELIYSYVGNGAPVLIRRALGSVASEEEVQKALQFFIAYYHEHSLDHTRLYDGVRESLDRFLSRGMHLAVLTNKPVRISTAILEGLGVGSHFFRIYGGNSFERKKPDPIGVEKLLEEAGIDRSRALMVGDSAVDVRTARNAGIPVCGVTYGFQPESFDADPPDFLVDHMEQLVDRLDTIRTAPLYNTPFRRNFCALFHFCALSVALGGYLFRTAI
jgi:phosphoglycolate phosphatase